MTKLTADAVVIGAGPNGLVAANALADAGWDVLLLEANDSVGGAVSSSGPPSPVKFSDPNRRTGNTANRARSSMPDNRLRPSNSNTALIGGIGVNMASSKGSRMRCQPSNISNQACPSPTPNSSRPAAVRVGSR